MQVHVIITDRRQRARRQAFELLRQYWALRAKLGRPTRAQPSIHRRLSAMHTKLVDAGVFHA